MMSPEQRKEIEERVAAAKHRVQITPEKDREVLLSALDDAEKRVEELEAALECSYTLVCRGVERIDEENKTCGPRLSLAHRRRLMIMCNQIRKHKDKWLSAKETPDAP